MSVSVSVGYPDIDRPRALRVLALGAVGVVTYSYVRVLHHVAIVVGDPQALVAVVAVALLAGVLVGQFVGPRLALSVGILLGVGGGVTYLLSLPDGWELVPLLTAMARDSLVHLAGASILQLVKLDIWVLGFAPGPVFLSWYFAVRRRYAVAVLVGGLTLGIFVLTSDASEATTLLGLVGAAAAIGLGELERHDGTWRQLDVLTVLLAVMVLAAMLAPVGASGGSNPFLEGSGGGTAIATQTERVDAVGSISLSPTPTFNVTASERHYWRVGAYDRYAGDSWVRSGGTRPYEGAYTGPLDEPPGETHDLRQQFTARRYISAIPAAAQPIALDGPAAANASVTLTGGLKHQQGLNPGDSYTVTSSVLETTPTQLRRAGTDYPREVQARYTQLPESTPERVGTLAANITRGAETPYGKAVRIERWLEANKNYSQNIRSPRGDMVAWFLFETDRGYCVYYASAMAVMLRTQGVPARFVLGYTSGEQVGPNHYVLRGLDSHAWVEVYFPEHGWVKFDPTPAAPRRAAERQLRNSTQEEPVEDPSPQQQTATQPTTTTPQPDNTTTVQTPSDQTPPANDGGGFDWDVTLNWDWLPALPTVTREQLALLAVALVGSLAASHYAGRLERARLGVTLLWHGRQPTPEAHAERAFTRLERLLGHKYWSRGPGETPREYLSTLADYGLDERAQRVGDIYERAHYAGQVDEAEAMEAVELVDDLVAETSYGRLLWLSARR